MKRIFIFSGILVIVFVVVWGIFFQQTKQSINIPNVVTPTPVPGAPVQFSAIDYGKVFPDPQIAQSAKDTLKNSSESSQQGDYTVLSFPTSVDQRQNLVYEKNNVAEYVMQEQIKDNNDLTFFINTHPNSQSFQLYDVQHAGSGFSWYVFPQDGIAFLANKDVGYAIKILYFPKTTQEEFLKTTAGTFQLSQQDPGGEGTQEGFQ